MVICLSLVHQRTAEIYCPKAACVFRQNIVCLVSDPLLYFQGGDRLSSKTFTSEFLGHHTFNYGAACHSTGHPDNRLHRKAIRQKVESTFAQTFAAGYGRLKCRTAVLTRKALAVTGLA